MVCEQNRVTGGVQLNTDWIRFRGDRWLYFHCRTYSTCSIQWSTIYFSKQSPSEYSLNAKMTSSLGTSRRITRISDQNIFLSTVLLLRPNARTVAVCADGSGYIETSNFYGILGGLIMSSPKEYRHSLAKTCFCHFSYFCQTQTILLYQKC